MNKPNSQLLSEHHSVNERMNSLRPALFHRHISKHLMSQNVFLFSIQQVCNGMVIIHLYKKEEISWNDMLTCGLEQSYDSSEDETCSVSDVQTAF